MQSSREADSSGQIILGATPIGNPADASQRLVEWLQTADLVAAEDTRRLLKLASSLGVSVAGRVLSYHEHNEASRTAELISQVRSGANLLMVSDAGMPAVSDPGYRLVQGAIEAGVRVTAIPGPSAVLTALALSGLPTDRFSFEGFLPRKAGERREKLRDLATDQRTMIFFEAPHRLAPMLAALAEVFGADRQVAVARELTKTFEEVLRGNLGELQEWAASSEVRGEIAVVVGGSNGVVASVEDQVAAVLELSEGGMRLKDAVAAIAETASVSKRELYEAVLLARSNS